MAGGNPGKGSNKPSSSSSSSHRKSRWESGGVNNNNNNNNNSPAAGQRLAPAAGDPKPVQPSSASKPSPSSSKPKPSPKPNSNPSPVHPNLGPGPFPQNPGPPPPPAYGFHMLERRTIVLADGSVRSYFALPPDYQDFNPPLRPPMDPSDRFLPHGPGPEFDRRQFPVRDDLYGHQNQDYWNNKPDLENSHKRKYGDERREEREGNDEFSRQRQQLLQYGNAVSKPNGYMGPGTSSPFSREREEIRAAKFMRSDGEYGFQQGRHGSNMSFSKYNEVDQNALKKAFLNFLRLINENAIQKQKYLADGKQGPLECLACGRSSKDFPDMHNLIMHTYNSDNARSDNVSDHLGLHKALCVLMGWNYMMPPDNLKAYQILSVEEAARNREDLIIWPPVVIIQNTITGKGRDGRVEGLGNKAMDNKLRDLGFTSGKSKSMYGKDGHMGTTMVKFAGDQSGLKEALRLAEFFEKENHGREAWAAVQTLLKSGKGNEDNPNLVKVDKKTGEKERIFYGFLGTVFDLDKVDFETRKKAVIECRMDYNKPRQ